MSLVEVPLVRDRPTPTSSILFMSTRRSDRSCIVRWSGAARGGEVVAQRGGNAVDRSIEVPRVGDVGSGEQGPALVLHCAPS